MGDHVLPDLALKGDKKARESSFTPKVGLFG
jgi:hypothetical protein